MQCVTRAIEHTGKRCDEQCQRAGADPQQRVLSAQLTFTQQSQEEQRRNRARDHNENMGARIETERRRGGELGRTNEDHDSVPCPEPSAPVAGTGAARGTGSGAGRRSVHCASIVTMSRR